MEGEAAALSCSAFDLSLNTYAAPISLNMGFDGKKIQLLYSVEREMKAHVKVPFQPQVYSP